MDISKLASILHPLERKVLPLLGKFSAFEDILKESGLKDVEVMRALQWLQNKNIIKLDIARSEQIVLEERIGFIDIETFTFNFKADMGFMMTYCIKDLDGKVHTNSVTPKELKQSKDWDKRLMEDCIKDMNKYTRLVGHYSTLFDIPFLRTRALYYDLDFL